MSTASFAEAAFPIRVMAEQAVSGTYIWFACVCSRKIQFASQTYQDMLHVLGQQTRWDSSCLCEERLRWIVMHLPCTYLLPAFFRSPPSLFLSLIIFQLIWLPVAHPPPSAYLKLSKIGLRSPFWHKGNQFRWLVYPWFRTAFPQNIKAPCTSLRVSFQLYDYSMVPQHNHSCFVHSFQLRAKEQPCTYIVGTVG